MCSVVECRTSKSFNYEGLRAEFCGQHKLEGMVNTKHELCDEIGCNKQASFGLDTKNVRIKCGEHKTDDMINLKSKNIKCLDISCIIKKNIIDGYCSTKCKLSNLSNELVCKTDLLNISHKEYLVYRFLQDKFNKVYWDKQITGTLYRPDFRIDFGILQILIEIDEYQHKTYDKNNEINRIEDIHNNLNIPLYVIRINPDRYVKNGTVINSCFNGNICVNTTEWTYRLNKLLITIIECCNKCISEKYEIMYLFYDDV